MISLLCGANLVTAQLRSLFDYPASALSVSDLEGQEAELLNVQTSRYSFRFFFFLLFFGFFYSLECNHKSEIEFRLFSRIFTIQYLRATLNVVTFLVISKEDGANTESKSISNEFGCRLYHTAGQTDMLRAIPKSHQHSHQNLERINRDMYAFISVLAYFRFHFF